ncbi:MAG TPA: UDP-glucose 4-epimerase GalE, partial [Petrotogaceae bacterium]|nr:UDP-glucose 4-epimerase GalE [Petrotogaceae bacterium]
SYHSPDSYVDTNIKGTLNLLKAMTEHNVKNIVFSSTAAVYGDPKTLPITEKQEKIPTNVYGQSKLMIEQIMNWYSKLGMINYAALRYFNAAGASLDAQIGEDHTPETHLIPLILQTVLGKREKITVFGNDYPTADGSAVRDYVHVLDLADAHIKAMKWIKENNRSDAFNLGNGEGFSVMQVIQKTQEVTGCNVKYEIGARRSGDPAVLIASSEKAHTVLGWTPRYSRLEEIIQTAYNWHKK